MDMNERIQASQSTLVIIICAARPARYIQDFIVLAQADGWDTHVVATPNAAAFIDPPMLEQLTGHLVEIHYSSTSPLLSCHPHAAVVVPATFNTLKKWASRETDTFALQLLLSWDASAMPILAIPRASKELAQEPDFLPSLTLLSQRGVHILYEPDIYPPNNAVPWPLVLAALFSNDNDSSRI